MLGYLYFRVAGEAYALVSIGLISFAAVAQFAPALLGGMYWRGGTRVGALAACSAASRVWAYTLMLPSVAKSGWIAGRASSSDGPFGHRAARARAAVRPRRARQPHPLAVLEPAGQRRALRRPVALARALGARGEPGAALRRRLPRAGGGADAGLLARPRPARRPAARSPSRLLGAGPGASGCSRSTPARAASPVERPRRRRPPGRPRRAAARRRRRQRLGPRHGRLGRAGGAARASTT